MADPLQDVQFALQRAMADKAGQSDTAAAMRQIGVIIGTAVRAMTDKAQTTEADQAAMRGMLQQLSASAADIVALMEAGQETRHDATPAEKLAAHQAEAKIKADAMAAAIGPLLSALKLPPPRVQVDVQPTAVTVPQPRVDVTVQPPSDKSGQQWRIEIQREKGFASSSISALVVTKL